MKNLKYNNAFFLFLSFCILPINAMEHLYKQSLKKNSPTLRPALQPTFIYLSGTDAEKQPIMVPWRTAEKIPVIKSMLSDLGSDRRNPPRQPLLIPFPQEQIQVTLEILKSYNAAPNRESAQNQLKNNSLNTLIESLPVLTHFNVEKNIETDFNTAILYRIKRNPQELLQNESIVTLDSDIREKIMTKPTIDNLENKLISQYNPQDKGKKVRLYQPLDNWIIGEFNYNGTQLAALRHSSLTLWDITDPTQPKKRELITNENGRNYARSAFSHKNNLLASSIGNRLTIRDTTDFNNPIAYELEYSGNIFAITFTPNDKYFIAGGSELTLWDITDLQNIKKMVRKTLKTGDQILQISCDAHQKYILSLIEHRPQRRSLTIFDTNDIDNIKEYHLESDIESDIKNAFFSPDGTKVVAYFNEANKHPAIPKATTEAQEKASKKIVVWDISTINNIKRYYLPDHTDPVINAAYNPINSELISADLTNIIFWDLSDLNDIKKYSFNLSTFSQRSMTLSPDGTKLASNNIHNYAEKDSMIVLWDITTSHQCTPILSLYHTKQNIIEKIKFSPDGTQILTESNELSPAENNTWYNGLNLILWNLITKEQKKLLQEIRNYEPNTLKVLLALSFASLDNITISLSDANLALIDKLPQEIKNLLLFRRDPRLYAQDISKQFSTFKSNASALATWISELIWKKRQPSPTYLLPSILKPIRPEAE